MVDKGVLLTFMFLFFSREKCQKSPQVSQVFYEDCVEHELRVKVDLGEFHRDPIFQVLQDRPDIPLFFCSSISHVSCPHIFCILSRICFSDQLKQL